MTSRLKGALFLLGLALSTAGAVNVYGESSAVEAMALEIALQGQAQEKDAQLISVQKHALSHHYVFQVQGRKRLQVKCQRAAVLVGAYACSAE